MVWNVAACRISSSFFGNRTGCGSESKYGRFENGADSEEDETGDTEDTAEDEADGENDTDEIIIDAEECEENLTEDIPDEDAAAEFPDISIETADNDNGAEEVFSAEGDEVDEFDTADHEAMVARSNEQRSR